MPTTPPTFTPTPTRTVADDLSSFPPFPNIYSGGVLVGGQSAPNGIPIFARIGSYETAKVFALDGRYSQLTAGPESINFYGLTITFHAIVNEVELEAVETAIFRQVIFDSVPPRNMFNTVALSFPAP